MLRLALCARFRYTFVLIISNSDPQQTSFEESEEEEEELPLVGQCLAAVAKGTTRQVFY